MLGQPTRSIPFRKFLETTPSDVDVFEPTDAIYVGGAGNLVVDYEGAAITFVVVVPTTQIIPLRTTRIYAATTATGIIRLYYRP